MWDVNIKVENRVKKMVRVHASHLVDGSVDFTTNLIGLIETPAQRSNILQSIKDNYLVFLDKQIEDVSLLAGLEDTTKNALNTWEDTL